MNKIMLSIFKKIDIERVSLGVCSMNLSKSILSGRRLFTRNSYESVIVSSDTSIRRRNKRANSDNARCDKSNDDGSIKCRVEAPPNRSLYRFTPFN